MSPLIFFLVFAANLGLAIRNSYACGKTWAETKFAGGFPRFANWLVALIAGSAMSWCFLILMLMFAVRCDWILPEWGNVGVTVGICLAPIGLISGLSSIPLRRWAGGYRTSRSLDFGPTYYGGFSDTYDRYHETRGVSASLGNIFKPFGGNSKGGKDDASGCAIMALIVIIILAVAAGALVTALIIQQVSASQPLPRYDEAIEARDKK